MVDEGMIFGRPLSKYGWKPMARVRKGQGVPGIHLGVWRERDELVICRTTRMIPMFCFVLEVVTPRPLRLYGHNI